MTLTQGLALAVLAVTIGLFIWDRLRYDVVAMLSLLAGIATGIVPMKSAFSGFADQVVIVMASALVVSTALARSGIVERLTRPLQSRLTTPDTQAAVLVGAVTFLSAFMKNIGALALFIPVALRLSKRAGFSPSLLLMPLAFGSLIGGLITLIGTSPNIVISRIRGEVTGQPFSMFDYAPVGLGIAVLGVVFLTFGWRLLPKERQARASAEDQFQIEDYLAEVQIQPGSALIGSTVSDIERLFSEGAITVAAIIRDQGQRYIPGEHWEFSEGDIVVLEGDPVALKSFLSNAGLSLLEQAEGRPAKSSFVLQEAVISPHSLLVGTNQEKVHIRSRFGVNVLAVSRGGRHLVSRLRQLEFQVGDVLMIEGPEQTVPTALQAMGLLPLAQRNLAMERKPALMPLLILAVAMVAMALEVVPVAVGFFATAVAMIVTGSITAREAYEAVDWSLVVMLGALIPVSDAVQGTGASDLIAGGLAQVAHMLPSIGVIGLMMLTAMALTPFLNNAATALVMGPIAASLAIQLGINPDAVLMAVAVGAACDFLTPIGHQCNTLVMGPGGYRFGDYWRLGLPLTCLVLVVGTMLIDLVWT